MRKRSNRPLAPIDPLTRVRPTDWLDAWQQWTTRPLTRAWMSPVFVVLCYREPRRIVRLSVYRRDGHDGITWDELQQIKRAAGYGADEAIEIYPPTRWVVNGGNMRHLWVLPAPLAWTWRGKYPSKDSE